MAQNLQGALIGIAYGMPFAGLTLNVLNRGGFFNIGG